MQKNSLIAKKEIEKLHIKTVGNHLLNNSIPKDFIKPKKNKPNRKPDFSKKRKIA